MIQELLEQYQIKKELTPLIKLQLTKLFNHYNKHSHDDQKKWENEFNNVQKQLKQLKIRFGLGEIDKETFDLTTEHLSKKLLDIDKELNNGKRTISNLEELLEKSLEHLENISRLWASSNLEEKRRLHKTLFPEGIYYDPKNHQYLTRKMNSYVELVYSLSTSCEGKKIGLSNLNFEKSCPVAEVGGISNLILEDLIGLTY